MVKYLLPSTTGEIGVGINNTAMDNYLNVSQNNQRHI